MKSIISFASIVLVCVFVAACEPANTNSAGNRNGNSNSNANAVKPVAAAPTKESLLALDKQAHEAYMKGDSKFFEDFLSEKFASQGNGQMMGKADMVKMVSSEKCDVKTLALDEPQMTVIDPDTALIVYKTTVDGTCTGPDGKSTKIPSPTRAASLYVQNGDKWLGAFHAETLIVDPKNPPSTSNAPPPKDADANAKPANDAATDAMLAVEKAGWEAWKARDAKKLEELTSKNQSFVDLFGTYTANQADTVKSWTGGKCDIKSAEVTDAAGRSISSTVGILTFKGTADGTCDGHKILPLYGTSIYVKEGDSWKQVFGIESPA